jgi:hypothetical protein
MLAACSGLREPPKEPDPNVVPGDFKTKVIRELHGRLPDPTGVRDATISEPALKQTGAVQRYISCVRYNAKDDNGKYAGLTERAIYFFNGEITQIVDDGAQDLCRGVPYQPFPELMRLCREIVCPERR